MKTVCFYRTKIIEYAIAGNIHRNMVRMHIPFYYISGKAREAGGDGQTGRQRLLWRDLRHHR